MDPAAASLEETLDELRQWAEASRGAVVSLQACREEVDANRRWLESPQAVLDYLEFFDEFLTRAAADVERVVAEAPAGIAASHLDALSQTASGAAAEERRCLVFRDKWINRPLPYEQVRPLLNRISNETRDELTGCRKLAAIASRLAAIAGPLRAPEPPAARTLGRRALFNRLLGREP